MKATLKLEDGREIQVELSDRDVNAIIKPKKTGWERLELGHVYYYFAGGGIIAPDEESRNASDDLYYGNGNYFSDTNLASDQIRAIFLWLRIKRWAAEHCEPEDWNNFKSQKYYIFYNHSETELRTGSYSTIEYAFGVYFDTEEHAKKCIEEFKDELLWYFTECKDRMDG